MSNALYGASLLQEHGYKINEQQAQQLVSALVQKRHQAKPQDVSNTLWAAATLGLQLPAQHVQQLVAALVQKRQDVKPQNVSNTPLAQKQADANPQHLSNALWAAATMDLQLPGQQALQLVAALVQKRQDAKPQELANTLWAAATLGLQLPEQQIQQLVAALVQKQADAAPQHLANTALVLAKLGLHDAQLFAALTSASKSKVQQFTSQGLCNLCWAAAVADQQQLVEEVVALCRQAGSGSMWSSTVSENLRQLYQVHLWLSDVQTTGSSSGLAGALSPAQLQQCKEAWEEQLDTRARQHRTQLEQGVYLCCAQQLHSLLTDCSQESRTEDGAFNVDVVATLTASGKRLDIEADGPTHFVRAGRQAGR